MRLLVGSGIEEQAQVRHVSRMFVAAAHLRVPFFGVVMRKGYGPGAMAMAAGGFHSPDFMVSWPTGEFGAMGLDGAVKLGYRKELEAAAPGAERDALCDRLVPSQYENGQALSMSVDKLAERLRLRERPMLPKLPPTIKVLRRARLIASNYSELFERSNQRGCISIHPHCLAGTRRGPNGRWARRREDWAPRLDLHEAGLERAAKCRAA